MESTDDITGCIVPAVGRWKNAGEWKVRHSVITGVMLHSDVDTCTQQHCDWVDSRLGFDCWTGPWSTRQEKRNEDEGGQRQVRSGLHRDDDWAGQASNGRWISGQWKLKADCTRQSREGRIFCRCFFSSALCGSLGVRESQVGQLRAEKASEMSRQQQHAAARSGRPLHPAPNGPKWLAKSEKCTGHAAGLGNKKSGLLSVLMILPSSHVSVHSKYAAVLVSVRPMARRPTAAERFQRYWPFIRSSR